MTFEQERHLARLNNAFLSENTRKYTEGVKEHKTLLTDIDVLDLLYNARDEVIDQWNYIQTAIDAIEDKL